MRFQVTLLTLFAHCERLQVAALPLSAADAFLVKQAENKGELRLALTGEQRGEGGCSCLKN